MLAVIHRTTCKQAAHLLKVGGLRIHKDPKKTGTGIGGMCFQGQVFGALLTKAHVGRSSAEMSWKTYTRWHPDKAVLVYDLKSLDLPPAHISNKYLFGKFVAKLSARPDDRDAMARVFGVANRNAASRREDVAPGSEVVWEKNVSNKYLREVWVFSRRARRQLLKDLEAKGVEQLNGRPIRKVVKVRNKVPMIR